MQEECVLLLLRLESRAVGLCQGPLRWSVRDRRRRKRQNPVADFASAYLHRTRVHPKGLNIIFHVPTLCPASGAPLSAQRVVLLLLAVDGEWKSEEYHHRGYIPNLHLRIVQSAQERAQDISSSVAWGCHDHFLFDVRTHHRSCRALFIHA